MIPIDWEKSEGITLEELKEHQAEFDFGLAIQLLKEGERVARQGWNGKGMWLVLVRAENYTVDSVRSGSHSVLPWIGMKTADDCFVPWLASQTDLLAEDWTVMPNV